jgi:hypothetical protein
MNPVIPVLVLVAVTVYWLWVYYQRLRRLAWEACVRELTRSLQDIPGGKAIEGEEDHARQDALTETDVAELEAQGWEPPARVVDRIERLRASRRRQEAAARAREAVAARRCQVQAELALRPPTPHAKGGAIR